jgi:hypothetical protein
MTQALARPLAAVLILLTACCRPTGAADPVDVNVVKYARLAEAVRQNKGKVVIVDLWASW